MIDELQEIALFPLNSVLFPAGKLELQIFEQRYLDLVSRSTKSGSGFGVCLLKEGAETFKRGIEPVFYSTGTYARIVDFDQLESGYLGITIEGVSKFQLIEHWVEKDGLIKGRVNFSELDCVGKPVQLVTEEFIDLVDLLKTLHRHPMLEDLELSVNYDNLWDVSWRLSDCIPGSIKRRQELLEIDDVNQRLMAIRFDVEKELC